MQEITLLADPAHEHIKRIMENLFVTILKSQYSRYFLSSSSVSI